MIGVGASFVLFTGVRQFARGSPDTMNKEYQEATNEYLKVCLPFYSMVFETDHATFLSWQSNLECYFAQGEIIANLEK